MELDLLLIEHHEFGTEKFALEKARVNVYQRRDGVWEFLVRVDTSQAIQRAAGLDADAQPQLEAAAVLANEVTLKAGVIIVQKKGYDYVADQNLSTFYYFEHESVEDLRVEILEASSTVVDAVVTGVAIVNGSNGREPDARISVRTRFQRDPKLRRSFS